MKTYKYTDDTNQVVHVIDEDGKSRMSCLASVLEDVTIEPADPIPEPVKSKKEKGIEKLKAATTIAQIKAALLEILE